MYAFVLQTLVQLLAFTFPPFLTLVHSTYTDTQIGRIYHSYGGLRGLSLSGSPSWGLTIGYGIAFILFFKNLNSWTAVNKFLIFILLVCGNFFAGRSGFLGLALGLVYYLTKMPKKHLFTLSFLGSIVIFILSFMYMEKIQEVLAINKETFKFALEAYYNYQNNGVIETRSTNILFSMWNVQYSDFTHLFGDGYFLSPIEDSYYQHTDVGYLRTILFGGVFFGLLVICIQGVLLLSFKSKFQRPYYVMIYIMLMIFEAKAMTVMFNKYVYIFTFVTFMLSSFEKTSIIEDRRD
ncbi:hypothetical protein [Vibrio harveyi]|uniref:hypothetical protein n=1 Tax=Vibrio harveyi TaxID=669 RepID=UPI00131AAB56|nr:hypothetical protein [Vibrio harveyi]